MCVYFFFLLYTSLGWRHISLRALALEKKFLAVVRYTLGVIGTQENIYSWRCYISWSLIKIWPRLSFLDGQTSKKIICGGRPQGNWIFLSLFPGRSFFLEGWPLRIIFLMFYSFFEDFGSQRYSILWYYTSISEIRMVGIYLWNKFMVFLLHL